MRSPLAAALAALLLLGLASGAGAAAGLRSLEGTPLGDLLERFDRAREEMSTLRAEFLELRESALFADPVRSSGRVLVSRPDTILWVYREPESRYFLLEGRIMTAWYPVQNIAERQNIRKHGQRLKRMLGLGESSEEMVRNNQVSLLSTSELPGTEELALVPRNRRIREYVAEVRLWIDRTTALARQVRYREPSGDQVTILLEDLELNPDLSSEDLAIPIPAGTEIGETLSSMGPFDSAE